MSIFYNSKNELVGIIKTDQLQVVAKSKIEETTNENIHTYTLVWNNIQKSLSLHRNGNLLANGVKTKTSNDKKTVGRYEYISLYNSYTSTKSYTHGSFLQFSISFLSAPGMLTNNLQGQVFRFFTLPCITILFPCCFFIKQFLVFVFSKSFPNKRSKMFFETTSAIEYYAKQIPVVSKGTPFHS